MSKSIAKLCRSVISCLTPDLLKPPFLPNPKNPLAGHCYVASEAIFHLLGPKTDYRPRFLRHEGQPHWYLENRLGEVLDSTAGQFETTPDYSKGRGIGFLTKKPSKRAKVLIKRVKQQLSK